ncbi:hypothetical protein CPAV1605_736 [seawater metagenome]|uniref:Uncharacterized protein n=1 Tax=seawater metagenome TaxID=1561972 RepID=A0A5E8CIH3_9ZZZZ
MMDERVQKLVMYTVAASIGLNIVIPMLAKSHVSNNEANPAEGVQSLSLTGQVMNNLSRSATTPVSSSILIAVMTGAALVIALYVMKHQGQKLPTV